MPGAACLRAAAFVIALPLGLGLFIVVICSILWDPFLFGFSFLSGRLVWCSDPSRLHFLVSTLFNLYIYIDDHPQQVKDLGNP